MQALKNKQIDGLVVDLPTAFYVTAVQVPNCEVLGQFPAEPGGEHFGMVFAKGNSLRTCVNQALTKLRSNGTLEAASAAVASEGDRRSDPEVERRSRLLGGLHFEGEGARGVAIALLSTRSS